MCLLHSSHVTDVTKKRKRRNKNLTAEWSRHRDKYAFTGAIIEGDRNTQAFLKSWKENSWLFAGSTYIGNNSRSKKTFLQKKCSSKEVDVKIHFVDYKQSDLFGEVRRARKKICEKKMILVRHGTLEVRYADINYFFHWSFPFTCALDFGKRRDCSLSIPAQTWLKTVHDLYIICNDHSKL